MGNLGAPELIIIGLVLVLLFGATRLPQTAKGLAQSLKIFKRELRDDDRPSSDDDEQQTAEQPVAKQLPAAAETAADTGGGADDQVRQSPSAT